MVDTWGTRGVISRWVRWEIGGIDQHVLLRGNPQGPPLLVLHGGPGRPLSCLAGGFPREMEARFLVAHWDQRGAGRSWSPRVPPETLCPRRLAEDGVEVARRLGSDFGRRKVALLGHSWGSELGVGMILRDPEPFSALLGVGQVVDDPRARRTQRAFLASRGLRLPRRTGDLYGHLLRFGGVFHRRSTPLLLWKAFAASRTYRLRDLPGLLRGAWFSARHFRFQGPPVASVRRLPVPVLLVQGLHDLVTPPGLAHRWLRDLEAPRKDWIPFRASGHFPFFEEPEAFGRVLEERLLPLAKDP